MHLAEPTKNNKKNLSSILKLLVRSKYRRRRKNLPPQVLNVWHFVQKTFFLKKACNVVVVPWSPLDFGVFRFFSKGLYAKGIKKKIKKISINKLFVGCLHMHIIGVIHHQTLMSNWCVAPQIHSSSQPFSDSWPLVDDTYFCTSNSEQKFLIMSARLNCKWMQKEYEIQSMNN